MGRSTTSPSAPTSSKSWCRRCAAATSSCSTTSPPTSNPRCAWRLNRPARSLRFLPPYSPDFNPIELAFAKLKAFFRAARPRTFDQVCELMAAALAPLHARRMRKLRQALRLSPYYIEIENALVFRGMEQRAQRTQRKAPIDTHSLGGGTRGFSSRPTCSPEWRRDYGCSSSKSAAPSPGQ